MSDKIKVSIFLNILLVIFEIIGLIKSFNFNGLNIFLYYTECSNILALIASSVYLYYIFSNKRKLLSLSSALKYISGIGLIITFLVVLFVLVPLDGISTLSFYFIKGAMLYHHLLCPIIAFISLLYFDKIKLNKRHISYAIIYTLTYGIVLVILNILKIFDGPYPFLRVYEQSIYMSITWFVVITGISYALSYIIYKKVIYKNNYKLN